MIFKFSQSQMELLHKIGFPFDVRGDLTDEQYFELDERVSDYLAMYGLSHDDKVNQTGRLCEDILDILSDA